MKIEEEKYMITPKGLFNLYNSDEMYDKLVLQLMRSEYNGIVVENGELEFIKLEKV